MKRFFWHFMPNPLDQKLKRYAAEGKKTFLIPWNRGLGDIAIALCALCHQIRKWIPKAHITFLTRKNLAEGFLLLEDVEVIVEPSMQRGLPFDATQWIPHFDVFIEHVQIDRWLDWQIKTFTPKLSWKESWDDSKNRFSLKGRSYIGLHMQTETAQFYDRQRDLSIEQLQELVTALQAPILLFGHKKTAPIICDNLIDLRGETSILELLSIIKNHCTHLIAPDSGILCLSYYLNADFPLKIVSFWGAAHLGILKLKTASPNPSLSHSPIIANKKDLSKLPVERIVQACR